MKGIIRELKDLTRLKWSRVVTAIGTFGKYLTSCEVKNDKTYYYKLSEYDPQLGIVGHECVNEVIAGRIMDQMEIEHLEYTLIHAEVDIDGHIFETWLCRWEDYKDPYESGMTMEEFSLAYKTDDETPMDFCIRKGWKRYVSEMLTIDYIILNKDRAGEHIEVLRDRFNKRMRLAPLFDQGVSFVSHIHLVEDLEGYDVMENTPVISFVGGRTSEDNLRLIPCSERKRLTLPEDIDKDTLFEGLIGILDERYFDLIWEMILLRIESARAILNI